VLTRISFLAVRNGKSAKPITAKVNKNSVGAAVAIIDWNTGGHHETYLTAYVRALLSIGRKVAVLSLDSNKAKANLGTSATGAAFADIPGAPWIKARRWVGLPLARAWFARRVKAKLAAAEQELGAKCDCVFLSCLYESQALIARDLARAIARPWAGLYLHASVYHAGAGKPAGKRADAVLSLLRDGNPEQIFMLDPGMAKQVQHTTGRPVVLAPDFTDPRPGQLEQLPEALRALGDGRPIVGLLGHLRPNKGVAELARLAVERSDLNLRFVFAGELERQSFSALDLAWIDRAKARPDRTLFYPHRLPDGPCYNALVEQCDVLWAVYPNSPHSSNTLTKAAAFQRPVVVADGHLMARQTRDYGLGEVIAPGDDGSAALARLTQDPAAWRASVRPRWAEFAALHSEERLRTVLRDWLEA
jgi:hypothetical protein